MSAAEMAKYLGQSGHARMAASNGGDVVRVPVHVIDARETFGRVDLQVVVIEDGVPSPELGSTWISRDNVVLKEGT